MVEKNRLLFSFKTYMSVVRIRGSDGETINCTEGALHVMSDGAASSTPPNLNIARGDESDLSNFQLNAYEDAVGGTLKVFWTNAADCQFLTSTVLIEIWSTSANDTIAGSGAQVVEVNYINDLMESVTSQIDMNGTTVVSVGEGYRVNSMRVIQAGSTMWNEGAIYTGYSSKSQVLNLIAYAQDGRERCGLWSTASNQNVYLKNVTYSNGGSHGCFVNLRIRDIASGLESMHSRCHITAAQTQSQDLNWLKVPPGHDFYMTIQTGGSVTNISATVNCVLETLGE